MHLVERLLDVFEPDAFGNEPLQRQPALQVKVDQRGKSLSGRQSPYHDDFSAPP